MSGSHVLRRDPQCTCVWLFAGAPGRTGLRCFTSHRQCVRCQFLQILAHTCYFSLSFCCLFLIKVILVGVKWCFIVVLIYISLTIDSVKHIFICLLVIVYFWRNTFTVLRA